MGKKILLFIVLFAFLLTSITFVFAAKPKAVLLTNSIDANLSRVFPGFLKEKGIEVTEISPADFPNYEKEKFIVILGGPDAPEGIGKIVSTILTADEINFLINKSGNRKMFVKTNFFEQGQVIMILAGRNRNDTKLVVSENDERTHNKIIKINATLEIENFTTNYSETYTATFLTRVTYSSVNSGAQTFEPTFDIEIYDSSNALVDSHSKIENFKVKFKPNDHSLDTYNNEQKLVPGTYTIRIILRKETNPDIIAEASKQIIISK